MTKKLFKCSAAILMMMVCGATSVLAQGVTLEFEDVEVNLNDAGSGGCIQIPIYATDGSTLGGGDGFEMNLYSVTVEILGDTDIITGSDLTQNFMIPNGLTPSTTLTGITAGFEELSLQGTVFGGGTVASCSGTGFNPANDANDSAGTTMDFKAGTNTNLKVAVNGSPDGQATWNQGTTLDTDGTGGNGAADIAAGERFLIAVMQIPFDGITDSKYLEFRFVTDGEYAGGNSFNYDTATRADIGANFDLGSNGFVTFTQGCSSASIADNLGTATGSAISINYEDPQDGGVGGSVEITVNHDAAANQIVVTPDDGTAPITVPASGGTSTTFTLTTAADTTPDVNDGTIEYGIAVQYDFGGTTVSGGGACSVSATWAVPTASVVLDPGAPSPGANVNFDVTLTNPVWDTGNSRYGTLTLNDGTTVIDLTGPVVTGNSFFFDDAHAIVGVDPAADSGSYTADVTGPAAQTASGTAGIGFVCPTATEFPSTNVTSADNADIFLADSFTVTVDTSDVSTIDFQIYHPDFNGGAPLQGTADAVITPGAGNDNFYVRARGFDATGTECFYPNAAGTGIVQDPDGQTGFWYEYDVNWGAPICADEAAAQLQLSDGTLHPADGSEFDLGESIVVQLVGLSAGVEDLTKELNIASASINGVAMTQMGPGHWEATVDASPGMTVSIVGVDGSTSTCSQSLLDINDFNCILLTTVLSPNLGGSITIEGTIGCTYLLFESSTPLTVDLLGQTSVATTTISDVGLGGGIGEGTFSHTVQPGMYYYVGISGDANGTILAQSFSATVPTLGEWALLSFILLLAGAAIVMMRRNRTA